MSNEKIKVLVISSSEILIGGMRSVLARSEFVVESCLAGVPSETDAALVIIDLSVPDLWSVFNHEIPVVALVHSACDEETLSRFSGAVYLYDSAQTILKKLRKSISSGSDSPIEGGELSPREKEILVCVAKGMLNKEIAYKYNLSIFTVMTHRKNITAKTGIKSIAGLTAYAILQGLIDIESIK